MRSFVPGETLAVHAILALVKRGKTCMATIVAHPSS